jgi:hypothetical protein
MILQYPDQAGTSDIPYADIADYSAELELYRKETMPCKILQFPEEPT